MENKLFQIGENWYQRTHRLREVWQNDSASNISRIKAYKLWLEMTVRVIYIKNEITKSRSNYIPPFAKGGMYP